jgi:hypothetical protein
MIFEAGIARLLLRVIYRRIVRKRKLVSTTMPSRSLKMGELLDCKTGDGKPRVSAIHTNTLTKKVTATKGKAISEICHRLLKPAVAGVLKTVTH